MTRQVMVAVPSATDAVRGPTFRMLHSATLDCLAADIMLWMPPVAGAPISAARNAALRIFLKSKCDALFFIDDDVMTDPGNVVKLLEYPEDFVAGIYPHRGDAAGKPTYPIQWNTGRLWEENDRGLIEAHGTPFGFTRITRELVERMVEAYPDRWYYQYGLKTPYFFYFDFKPDDHIEYSEDFTFCRLWREIGGKVWVDPSLDFMHVGTKGYVGRLDTILGTMSDPEIEKAAD